MEKRGEGGNDKTDCLYFSSGMTRKKDRIKHVNMIFELRHPILLYDKHAMISVLLHLENNHKGLENLRSFIEHDFQFEGLRNALEGIKNDFW